MTESGRQGEHELPERERAARDAIRAASAQVRAPGALRARIEAEGATDTPARPRRRWSGLRLGLAGAAALAAIAVAVVVVNGAGGPTVAETAAVACDPPPQPAPPAHPPPPTLPAARSHALDSPHRTQQPG